ncbi:MAG: hypothetical protein SWO11_18880 [Thermodesulfobacteriota bacterium]|nr:hypothetical protein [Thermodesulfobacteriota bacterium]
MEITRPNKTEAFRPSHDGGIVFNPVCHIRVEYEALWGNSCSSPSIIKVHVFHNPDEGLWLAHTSPAWTGGCWAEEVATSKEEAISRAVYAKANENRREHSRADGPWEGEELPSIFGPIVGSYSDGASIEKIAKVSHDLLKGGPAAVRSANTALISALPKWSFDRASTNG